MWTYSFDDCGGAECVNPGAIILNNGDKQFVVDANDHGWNDTGLGSAVQQHRADVITKIIEIARRLCVAMNSFERETPLTSFVVGQRPPR